ncbi:hypothetical protein [Pantanalinema sp. GBBB05]|uniref:hypothetical protein n=1 Tax=Pantanalinema sp. GBBB05 TaxID=2604139 RepID=UPI001D81B21E|nr:hypothetical protein [Pantanalinema sp. GBBB05]
MATVRELRQQAKAKRVKGYGKMNKAKLLGALGMTEEAKAHKSMATRRKAAAYHATQAADGSSGKKALAKSRIKRSIKSALDAHQKQLGRELTQDEKRTVAAKAIKNAAADIKAGKTENRPKKGGGKGNMAPSQAKTGLSDAQESMISSHMEAAKAGKKPTTPTRVLHDGKEHWLEMKSKDGQMGALPISADGTADPKRAKFGSQWEAHQKGMKTVKDVTASEKTKLSSAQTEMIAAHIEGAKAGKKPTMPTRVLHDGKEHWLEMQAKDGQVGAVPIGVDGKADAKRGKFGKSWQEHQKGMAVARDFGSKKK